MIGSRGVTYLLHSKCGNNVYLDITSMFKIVTSFGLLRTGLKIRAGKIVQLSEVDRPTFYCTNCRESFQDLDYLTGTCFYCGGVFPVKELVSPSTSNGMYCKKHGTSEIFPGESIKDLKSILSKVYFK